MTFLLYPVLAGYQWTIGPANSTPDPGAAPWRCPMDLRCPHCGVTTEWGSGFNDSPDYGPWTEDEKFHGPWPGGETPESTGDTE